MQFLVKFVLYYAAPFLSPGNAFLLEFMGSVFFYLVIAQTALDERGIGGSFFPPLAIGLSLVVVHLALIPFTGCGVNPARTFGPSMITCMAGNCDDVVSDDYWVYYIGPFTASFVVAELTYWLKKLPKGEETGDDEQGQPEQPAKAPVEEAQVQVEEVTEA